MPDTLAGTPVLAHDDAGFAEVPEEADGIIEVWVFVTGSAGLALEEQEIEVTKRVAVPPERGQGPFYACCERLAMRQFFDLRNLDHSSGHPRFVSPEHAVGTKVCLRLAGPFIADDGARTC